MRRTAAVAGTEARERHRRIRPFGKALGPLMLQPLTAEAGPNADQLAMGPQIVQMPTWPGADPAMMSATGTNAARAEGAARIDKHAAGQV